MGERTGNIPNIPGIVNGIPKFSFAIPVFVPKGFPKEKMTDDFLETYVRKIVEPLVSARIGDSDNDIDYEAEPTVYGAGDFVVKITISKHPDRRRKIDYYQTVLVAVRDMSYISGLEDFKTGTNFLLQGHAVAVPPPRREAA